MTGLGFGNDFLDTMSKSPSMRGIVDKQDFVKMKHFCSTKDMGKRMKR